MAKELTHRADELQALGWSKDDVSRYAELWDYRQRWGAMNLERDDRLFLRKAEAALPKLSTGKASIKKPLKDKSYYKWLCLYLDAMNREEKSNGIKSGNRGVWPILIEEELRALDYYQPVLGLPDTIKAKSFLAFREEIVESFISDLGVKNNSMNFDFDNLISHQGSEGNKSWKALRDGVPVEDQSYPIVNSEQADKFREKVRHQLLPLIRETMPSLSDCDKTQPPDDWSS